MRFWTVFLYTAHKFGAMGVEPLNARTPSFVNDARASFLSCPFRIYPAGNSPRRAILGRQQDDQKSA